MKIGFFANTDWYLYNFRMPLANYLRENGHVVVMICPQGDYCDLLEKSGFEVVKVPLNRKSINPFDALLFIGKLRKTYQDHQFDLVHNFTIKSVLLGSIAARLSGVESVVNAVAGMGYIFSSDSWKAEILRPIMKVMLMVSHAHPRTRLILQNPDDRSDFINNKLVPKEKIRLILGSGVNTEKFSANGSTFFDTETVRVLIATRLLWEKGLKEYVESAKRMSKDGANVEFLLAGSIDEGNPGAVNLEELQRWENDGYIKYLGHVSDMPKLLNSVDIAVLPSFYREGVPRFLIESAASGLPIITTDTPGCREVVIDRLNGYLVQIKSADDLTDAIKSLVDDPLLRKKMGRESRRIAQDKFSEERVFSETTAVYSELSV